MKTKYSKAYQQIKENCIKEITIKPNEQGKINGAYLDIEEVVAKVSTNRKVVRKSYFISVELIENVLKYGYFNKSFKNKFLLGYNNGQFYFLSGNLVLTNEVEFIKSKLDEINSVFESDNSKDLLRSMYKEKLKEIGLSEESVKLGIIDLARKLDSKILYNFEQFDAEYSSFSIICTVDDKEL